MRVFLLSGFPDSSVGKESACSAGDPGLIPGLGWSTGEGIGYPLQYYGLENFMDCIVHGVTKSRTWLSDFHFHFTFLLWFVFSGWFYWVVNNFLFCHVIYYYGYFQRCLRSKYSFFQNYCIWHTHIYTHIYTYIYIHTLIYAL